MSRASVTTIGRGAARGDGATTGSACGATVDAATGAAAIGAIGAGAAFGVLLAITRYGTTPSSTMPRVIMAIGSRATRPVREKATAPGWENTRR